ncbi:MAG: RCC1 domain-containing protein, partial [Planctomycetota bacterium]
DPSQVHRHVGHPRPSERRPFRKPEESVPPLAFTTSTRPDGALAAGGRHAVARRSDHSLVAWGSNVLGQCNVPAPPAGLAYVEVAASVYDTVARRSDGSVVSWGGFYNGSAPALPAGFAHVTIAAGRLGNTVALVDHGSYALFGGGCSGSLGVPTLVLTSPPPRIGQGFSVRADRLPLDMAFMLLGLSNLSFAAGALPFPLAVVGMPGCDLRVSNDVAVFQSGIANYAVFTFALPSSTALIGFGFHQQALVPDPGTNGFGAVMSDAATVVLGS